MKHLKIKTKKIKITDFNNIIETKNLATFKKSFKLIGGLWFKVLEDEIVRHEGEQLRNQLNIGKNSFDPLPDTYKMPPPSTFEMQPKSSDNFELPPITPFEIKATASSTFIDNHNAEQVACKIT